MDFARLQATALQSTDSPIRPHAVIPIPILCGCGHAGLCSLCANASSLFLKSDFGTKKQRRSKRGKADRCFIMLVCQIFATKGER